MREQDGRRVDPVGDGEERGSETGWDPAADVPVDDVEARIEELRQQLIREHEAVLQRRHEPSAEGSQPAAAAPPEPLLEAEAWDDPEPTDIEPIQRSPGTSARPRIDARIGLAAAVILAGVAGMLAGRWTIDDKPPVAEPVVAAAEANPVAEFSATLNDELEVLTAAREPQLRALRDSRTPDEQAGASRELADAHDGAARSLARAAVPAALRAQSGSLVISLRKVANAYDRFASGAAGGKPDAYEAGLASIRSSEAGLKRRLSAIETSQR